MAPFAHRPVLLGRVVELLGAVPDGWVVDATLGGGGHSAALLEANRGLRVLGIDRDDAAIAAASERLAGFGDRVVVVRRRFDEIRAAVESLGVEEVSGVLFDLGVSSPQLDQPERGFSYREPGPLDMRMDRRQSTDADQVVNRYSAERLAEVLDRYGDERYATRIARAVVAARPIADTAQLAEVVRGAIPAPARRSGGHPAKRTFQAIRIEVNDELGVLVDALDQAIDLLTPGGRCVALSYHSGEDRIVKERFRRAADGGCECPPGLPCVCGATPRHRLLKRGAEKASAVEVEENPRAASVRLRAIEAIDLRGPGRAATRQGVRAS